METATKIITVEKLIKKDSENAYAYLSDWRILDVKYCALADCWTIWHVDVFKRFRLLEQAVFTSMTQYI